MLPDQCYCKYVGTFDMWHLVITATLDENNVVFICEDRPPHLTLVHFVQIFNRNSRKFKRKERKWMQVIREVLLCILCYIIPRGYQTYNVLEYYPGGGVLLLVSVWHFLTQLGRITSWDWTGPSLGQAKVWLKGTGLHIDICDIRPWGGGEYPIP